MPGPLVLVVDDQPENLRLARLLLKSRGYSVALASDAAQALRRIRRRRPRLVLTDVQLPGMDGLDLAARLKSDPATKDILIVALTAAASAAGRTKALAAGCDGYVAKPVDTRRLARQIDRLLAGKSR